MIHQAERTAWSMWVPGRSCCGSESAHQQTGQALGLCSDPCQLNSGHGHLWVNGSPLSAARSIPLVVRCPPSLPRISLYLPEPTSSAHRQKEEHLLILIIYFSHHIRTVRLALLLNFILPWVSSLALGSFIFKTGI